MIFVLIEKENEWKAGRAGRDDRSLIGGHPTPLGVTGNPRDKLQS